MEPHVADLIEALPEDVKGVDASVAEMSIASLVGEMARQPAPLGRFRRMRVLGTLQAKIAAAYFAYWIRTSYKGIDEKQQKLNETHLKAALELLGGMSYLRGAILKVGQMIANYPSVAPEAFADVLGRLHFEAPPMHFSLLREFTQAEWGSQPEELFDDFETTAFAAASLGQVHRARLKGSRERVAVKIQYPSIGRTIRDDFRNLKAVMFPMRLHGDWDSLKQQFEAMLRMLERETDYEEEAANLALARSAFREDDEIVVPRVYHDLSTKKVLTMEHIDGVHLADFMRSDPPQELRDRFGEKIATASARLWYSKRLLYADPHPGNYFFMPDGRLGLVDFGCCHPFSDDEYDYVLEMEQAAEASPAVLAKALMRAVDLPADRTLDPDHRELIEKVCEWVWEPVRQGGPFDFGDPNYFQRGTKLFGEVFRRRYFRSLPVNLWVDRNFLGLRALAHRLKARIDLRAILRREAAAASSGAGESQEV